LRDLHPPFGGRNLHSTPTPLPARFFYLRPYFSPWFWEATLGFRAQIKGELEGPRPTTRARPIPGSSRARQGKVSGYGKVTQVFTFLSDREVDGCIETTGDVLWTLISDPESTS